MLEGVKVLSFTHFLQGPSAVQMLADVGADVVKVEPAGGAWERQWAGLDAFVEGISVFFLLANRNQRSIVLDLRNPHGLEIAHRLVSEADVLVENYRPGVMDKLGLGYEELKKINPRLIYCSCTGYGSSGPYVARPGQDLLLQAMSGLAMLSGEENSAPVPVGSAIVDQHAATLAAFGVVAALHERARTGLGTKVESNLLNAALDLQIEPFCYYMNKGPLWERSSPPMGSRFHPAPYGIYRTADDWVALSITPLASLAVALEQSELANFGPKGATENREEVHALVCAELVKRTTQQWEKIFEEHGIWYAPVNNYDRVEVDPQVRHNEVILEFEHPHAGPIRVLAHPVRYNGKAPSLRRIPPQPGEHTREVLSEVGYSQSEIDVMVTERAAQTPAGRPE